MLAAATGAVFLAASVGWVFVAAAGAVATVLAGVAGSVFGAGAGAVTAAGAASLGFSTAILMFGLGASALVVALVGAWLVLPGTCGLVGDDEPLAVTVVVDIDPAEALLATLAVVAATAATAAFSFAGEDLTQPATCFFLELSGPSAS